MLDAFTREEINARYEANEDCYVFVRGDQGDWAVFTLIGSHKTGTLYLSCAWDVDHEGSRFNAFGNGDRGHFAECDQIFAIIDDTDQARSFFASMVEIEAAYHEDCAAPRLKMTTAMAVLVAKATA